MESGYCGGLHEEPSWPPEELPSKFPKGGKTKGKSARKRDSTNRARRQGIKFT